jgi:ATP-dependent Clp protease ATP-binding subunit ClpC
LSNDTPNLAAFGTDLTALADQGLLPRTFGRAELRASLAARLRSEPRRSIALLGAAGTGKTALVQALAYDLADLRGERWRIVRVSPADFMAGTRYLGEWETKVKELVASARKPQRVIIYIPNLSDLATAGTWKGSDSSVATALAPYLEDGSVLVIGESTPEEYERGLGRMPSLRRVFDRVLVEETSVEETREILTAVRGDRQIPIADDVIGQLLEVSGQFLSHVSRPGSAVTLLRSLSETARSAGASITHRDVLQTLSRSTGVPVDLLDDQVPLDATALRAFFEARIIGQADAVDAMVDLVTLVKAGLTDPQKPFGVLLFVGPTGVGKTELARALAEFIFGDAARLKRFDMSEFASPDAFVRLIGSSFENGLLTDAVRQHPFSVILLDEIEKSHINVFDLCLQLFDAGRLTDGRGRTVDFRRTIVILTSNIGAAAPPPTVGFGARKPSASVDTERDHTFRELSRFFRPEFLNRLDRIVQFGPLSLEVAERIARREIELALQRAGIKRRSLTVDVAPSVVALLVREGYSPHFGARPLKRTVERLLLLPVARFITSGKARDRSVLHLTARDGRIEIAAKGGEQAPAAVERPQRKADPLQSVVAELIERFDELDAEARPLAERKSELLQTTQQSGFYDDARARAATFDQIHKLDEFLSSWERLGEGLRSLDGRLHRRPVARQEESGLRESVARLTAELEHLRVVASSRDAAGLGDAVMCISLVQRSGQTQDGVQKLARMYQALADRRRLTAEVLGEYWEGHHDVVWLQIAGLGAYARLKSEHGLHQLDRRFKARRQRGGRETLHDDRELLRVEVLPVAGEPDAEFRRGLTSKVTTLKPTRARVVKADTSLWLLHQPTLRSITLWTAGPGADALERAVTALQAQLAAESSAGYRPADEIVRCYDLGLGARVHDTRTGHSTNQVGRVLKGHLDLLS